MHRTFDQVYEWIQQNELVVKSPGDSFIQVSQVIGDDYPACSLHSENGNIIIQALPRVQERLTELERRLNDAGFVATRRSGHVALGDSDH